MRPRPGSPIDTDDASLVEALRAGDEAAFTWLVRTYHPALVRLARGHVPSDAIAAEVAQEAWLGVLKGINRFESRSSLKTWIFRITMNIARTRGARERRSIPVSSLGPHADTFSQDRFHTAEPWASAGRWESCSTRWDGVPDARAEAHEVRGVIARAIDALPCSQRNVIVLRDIEQLSSEEVCSLLDVTQGNQRLLLHRARAKVRHAVSRYLEPSVAAC